MLSDDSCGQGATPNADERPLLLVFDDDPLF